jgi:hypothetical protein
MTQKRVTLAVILIYLEILLIFCQTVNAQGLANVLIMLILILVNSLAVENFLHIF